MTFSSDLFNNFLWLALLLILPLLVGLLAHRIHQPGMAQMAHSSHIGQRVRGILDKKRRRGASRQQRLIGAILIIALIVPLISQIERRTLPLAHAQDHTLTVALPEDLLGVVNRDALYLDEFEAAHPGVKVVLRRGADAGPLPDPVEDTYGYLDTVTDFADTADVLYIPSSTYVTPITTRAGLFLNLAPVVAGDMNLDINRYFPAAWASYQWDNGLWVMPTLMTPVYLVYNRPAFDAAGLTYPAETWTMTQFADAARALTTTNANGTVIPGLAGDPTYLFRALLNRPFYDMTDAAQTPLFESDPDLIALAEQWLQLAGEGAAALQQNDLSEFVDDPVYDFLSPLQIATSAASRGDVRTIADDADWSAVLLPGGTAGLENVAGFAVSSATQAPELAYELAKHLSVIPTYLDVLPNASLSAVSAVSDGGYFNPASNETQRTLDLAAAQNAIPLAERTMTPFLIFGLSVIAGTEFTMDDLLGVLQQADSYAADALAIADERRPAIVLNIPPEPASLEVPSGEVALQFHLLTNADNIYNMEQWQQAAAEFAAEDDVVFSVNLLTGHNDAESADCYLADAPFPNTQPLNLAPLTSVDVEFDTADFVRGVLPPNEQLFGYPLALQPETVWADMNIVNQTGMTLPAGDWDITTFVEIIMALKDQGLAEQGLFSFRPDGLHLLMLMAGYGVLPIDFRTTPATIDLTNPDTIAGIRRVLDLEKQGYISDANTTSENSFDAPLVTVVTAENVYNFAYDAFMDILGIPEIEIRAMNYPYGNEFSPVSYKVLSGYINSTTQNADACYRWLRHLAQRPDLVIGIPARYSLQDNPVLETVYGPQMTQTFRDFMTRLAAPDAVIMPVAWYDNAQVETAVGVWIREAFDAYINEDADLATTLTQAQDRIDTFRACLGDLPQNSPDYAATMPQCAVGVDPEIMSKSPFSTLDEGQ